MTHLCFIRQKEYQISVENDIFDDPFHKKGPVLIILVSEMIQEDVFWWTKAEASEAAEATKADESN